MEGEAQQQPSLSGEEIVLITDENNVPIGKAARRDVRKQNLWHRASYIFVYEKKEGEEISFSDEKGFPRESKGSAYIHEKLKALGL